MPDCQTSRSRYDLIIVRDPNPQSPIPKTQSRSGSLGRPRRRSDFGGEIAFLLLDPLAELETDIGFERDRRAGLLAGGGDDVLDLGLVVHHEELREQGILLAELGHRAFDHLLDDLGRLAAFGGLLARDRALALD